MATTTPTPLEAHDRAVDARIRRARRALKDISVSPLEGIYPGIVPPEYLREAAKASWRDNHRRTPEWVLYILGQLAEEVGLIVNREVDDLRHDFTLRIYSPKGEYIRSLFVQEYSDGPFVIEGRHGWEVEIPMQEKGRWRAFFRNIASVR